MTAHSQTTTAQINDHEALYSQHTVMTSGGIMGSFMGVISGLNYVLSNQGGLVFTFAIAIALLALAIFGGMVGMLAASLLSSFILLAVVESAAADNVNQTEADKNPGQLRQKQLGIKRGISRLNLDTELGGFDHRLQFG
ncbi:MAG TPA: hypothetical protein VD999_04140 [Vitreimonas sp.]|nr:hypothetical protein [Vitreimonas sp.]